MTDPSLEINRMLKRSMFSAVSSGTVTEPRGISDSGSRVIMTDGMGSLGADRHTSPPGRRFPAVSGLLDVSIMPSVIVAGLSMPSSSQTGGAAVGVTLGVPAGGTIDTVPVGGNKLGVVGGIVILGVVGGGAILGVKPLGVDAERIPELNHHERKMISNNFGK